MRTRIAATTLLTLAHAGLAWAAPDFTDMAQVISATPITERIIEQRQECLPEPAPAPARERSVAAPIVGGIAGALLGNQIGRGSGRAAATVGGAVAGAFIGDRIGNAEHDRVATTPPAQRCRMVETTRDTVRGYSVVYRYNGREVTTTLPYDPGSTVRVAVGVADGPPAVTPAPPPATTMSTTSLRETGTTPPPPPPPSDGYQYRY